ncbi:GNAT family N-acetyltransferase [Streptomyces griseorubiginosus]|uniref:GNAT family N-acetyltransferase n=1 Tax=Streptomyces griseorubiginosus TaxID=67304 RepID=UPI001AD76A31|nr:GNAT family N-acetyltransferase [Streptomyces griseorubiginosus]MBO4254057.1 GNAT family N-acetyltransferase [Streptomyces griseorubiginosus]
MQKIVSRLTVPATPSAPALVLRPWQTADVPALVDLIGDEAMRRWTSWDVEDAAGAGRWVRAQRRGWEAGDRFAFAVVEAADGEDAEGPGTPVGHVVLKRPLPGASSAEVGYWTAARARGRGVAPRAVRALTEWAFEAFAGEGLVRLELRHQVDNAASCRVAEKCRYGLGKVLPAAPPAFPLDGHVHVRTRES